MIHALFTLLLICLIFPYSVQAAVSPSIALSPAKYDLALAPGQYQEVTIKVTNQSDIAMPLSAMVMDFAPKDNNGAVEFNKSLPGRSAVSWFQLPEPDILLNAKESKQVKVRISPPDNINLGSYFAVVMFQAELPNGYFDSEAQAKIVPWIGTLFLLQYGQLPPIDDNSITLENFSMPLLNGSKEVPVIMELKNNTGFHLSPKAEFTIKSIFGPVKAKLVTEETTIMPGLTRKFDVAVDQNSILGLYKGDAAIQVADYYKTVATDTVFLLTWQGIVMLVVMSSLFGVGVRSKQRIFVAIKAFIAPGKK